MRSVLRQVRWIGRPEARREVPIYICCYHKVGTKLLRKVFKRVCVNFGWKFGSVAALCTSVPRGHDVIHFPHSLVDLSENDGSFAAIHVVRDPRDVIVSGYLYHMRCREPWCTNSNFDATSPITYPIVPRSQEHRSDTWKRRYLASLGSVSYQDKLKGLSQEEGLLFEMDHYGAWTIQAMESWNYALANTLEVKFEDIMSDFEKTFNSMFDHVGFTPAQKKRAVSIASKEDISRMSDKEIMVNNHISSRSTSKWFRYFTPDLKEAFKARFPDVLQCLGYESSSDW